MGKKHGKGKKKTILSLAEFNQDTGLVGVDPELSALPSAPKAAEEWDAEGGRPEYNSRGYKERTSHKERRYDNDVDFQDHDWARKGPLDEQERGNGFGMGGPDRDWGDMRRGPLDAPQPAERDWNDMRRGPVDSVFDAAVERDWAVRKGPIDAEPLGATRAISDKNWSSARKMTVEAEFPSQQPERDWAVRRGPVEAQTVVGEVDWTARKEPIETEFSQEQVERDWTQRKAPIETEVPAKQVEIDWEGVRRGPLESKDVEEPTSVDRDWSVKRAPVDADVEAVQKGVREIDFGEMRRGSRLQEVGKSGREIAVEAHGEGDAVRKQPLGRDSWRREGGGVSARRDRPFRERPASTGHDSAAVAPERDWGAARRTQPLKEREPRPSRLNGGRVSDVSESSDVTQMDGDANGNNDDDDDWTTVRSGAQKRASANANRRHSGREGQRGFQKRGSREFRGERSMRTPLEPQNKTTTSPLTPVTSAMSEL